MGSGGVLRQAIPREGGVQSHIQMSAVEHNVNGKATLAASSRGGGMGADNNADQENVQVRIAPVVVVVKT